MAGRRRKVTASPPPQPIGADGYPITSDYGDEAFLRTLEFEDREAERAERTRAQSDEALLRTLERAVMKDHYFPALMDALELCRKENHPLPRWLHDRIWEILDHVYNAKAKNWKRHEAETKRQKSTGDDMTSLRSCSTAVVNNIWAMIFPGRAKPWSTRWPNN